MSYCRPGELGSDVYVYTDGEQIHCDSEGKRYSTSSHQEMIDHLRMHVRRGHHVPRKAFDRLEAERDGLPYETDVERALREWKKAGLL